VVVVVGPYSAALRVVTVICASAPGSAALSALSTRFTT
jgi:hypothetical protein